MVGILDNGSLTLGQQIEAIYVAYFGRAGDSGGFAYWKSEYQKLAASGENTDQVLGKIANTFSSSGEAKALYPILSRTAPLDPTSTVEQSEVANFVASAYQNLFNLSVSTDSVSVQYWAQKILNGRLRLRTAVLAIANGAQGADATFVDNKIRVALDFTTQTSAAGQGFGTTTPAMTPKRALWSRGRRATLPPSRRKRPR